MNNSTSVKKFLPIVIGTVFALILIGGIVRSTGSGMGCPDWPKCFGFYVPPTDVSELPLDYKERFAVAGKKVAEFSVFKTWTEYLNRLFGVWTGIAVIILTAFAARVRKSDAKTFWFSFGSLVLVVLNGWLGAKVVASHLKPIIITAHMLLAVFLVFVLQELKIHLDKRPKVKVDSIFKYLISTILLLTLVQLVIGTQVREAIDHITNTNPDLHRSLWVDRLGTTFYIHRSFSILLILALVAFLKRARVIFKDNSYLSQKCFTMVIIVFAEIAAGVGLAYFSFPAFLQPIHLLLSVVLLSVQYEILSLISISRESNA